MSSIRISGIVKSGIVSYTDPTVINPKIQRANVTITSSGTATIADLDLIDAGHFLIIDAISVTASQTLTLSFTSKSWVTNQQIDTTGDFSVYRWDGNEWNILKASGNTMVYGKSGKEVQITETTLSGVGSVDYTLDPKFKSFRFEFANVDNASNSDIYIRTSTDGGSTFDSTAGDYEWTSTETINTAIIRNSTSDTQMETFGVNIAPTDGFTGFYNIIKPSDAKRCYVFWYFGRRDVGLREHIGTGMRDTSADVDAIRFLASVGTFSGGIITQYGTYA